MSWIDDIGSFFVEEIPDFVGSIFGGSSTPDFGSIKDGAIDAAKGVATEASSGFDLGSIIDPVIGAVTGGGKVPAVKPDTSSASSFLNPNVLAAIITSGASLTGGLAKLGLEEDALKAQKEKEKMDNLLGLAKLKYQLMGKGSGGGGGRGSGGSGSADQARNSANKVTQFNNLGSTLAGIYG